MKPLPRIYADARGSGRKNMRDTPEESKLKHAELTEKIIGIYYDVYNEIGHDFLESVYSSCMNIALTQTGFQVEREVFIPVLFRSQNVGKFKADLLVDNLNSSGIESRTHFGPLA